MSDSGTIKIKTGQVDHLKVDLGGEVYTVKPMKGAVGMMLSARMKKSDDDPEKIMEIIQDLTRVLFKRKDAKRVEERLWDGDDPLDVFHIMELMNAVIERATGNPTM